jgi:uncharacterized protein YodC (DUF2158 family)
MIEWIRQQICGTQSAFRTGEAVVLTDGNQIPSDTMMVITRIFATRKSRTTMIECSWTEGDPSSTKKSVFSENKLKPFDWNSALDNLYRLRKEESSADVESYKGVLNR